MLEVDGLDVAYGEVQVLFDLSLTVSEGEHVALIGPNGAGKSTLFRAISGNLQLMDGDITYRGQSISSRPPHEILRRGICHVPQLGNIFTTLSVQENLMVGAYTTDEDELAATLEEVYELFPRLAERSEQQGSTLSGGERQMLGIARGLMSTPDLLLLDEPTAGLAPYLVDEVFERIREIHSRTGTTIFLVEQRVSETLEFADRIYVLENGRIQLSGSPKQLLEQEDIRQTYLGI